VQQDGFCVCVCGRGVTRMNSKFDSAVFLQQAKVNCQTERNAEIKYDKDTRKIKSKFIFIFTWKLHSLL